LRLERAATEEDIENYPGPYTVFQKQQAAINQSADDGYPLVMWPPCTPPLFAMLSARGISTVEGLAKLAGRGGNGDVLPAELRELAQRAVKLISMQKDVGKFEAIIREKDGELEALKEQIDEALKTITTQKAVIDKLKLSSVA
jgi:hypothetical protein